MSARPELRVRELSPRGVGGVSVIELRGRGALAQVRTIAPALDCDARGLRVVRLALGSDALDQAVASIESDELVELHVHGSPPLVRRLLQLLGAPSASEAHALTLEERASALLASAPCDAAARILLDQSEGALRAELERIVRLEAAAARVALAELQAAARIASFAIEPRLVVLAGPVNAGKSTLFNALFGARRVVVSASAGTTRDAVCERVDFGTWPVDLCDTAGERELATARDDRAADVERAGQALARDARSRADFVLWLQPCDDARPNEIEPADPRTRVLSSCSDRVALDSASSIPPRIAALVRPAEAVRIVHDLYREAFDLPLDPWSSRRAMPFDNESRAAVEAALQSLSQARDDWRDALRTQLAHE